MACSVPTPSQNGRRQPLNIRDKVLISYFVLLLVMVCTLVPAMLRVTTQNIESKDKTILSTRQRQIAEYVSNCHETMTGCGNAVLANLNSVSKEWWDSADYLSRLAVMSRMLTISKAMYPQVGGIIFVDSSGNIYATDVALERRCQQDFPQSFLDALEKTQGSGVNFGITDHPGLILEDGGRSFAVGKRLLHISSGQTLGYTFVLMDEAQISSKFEEMKLYARSDTFLIDENSQIVSSVHPEQLGTYFSTDGYSTLSSLSSLNFGGASASVLEIPNVPLSLVQTIPAAEIYSDLYFVVETFLFFALFGVVLSVLLALYLSRTLTGPLQELSRSMELVGGGNLDVRCQVTSNDEIGFLAEEFNKMVGEMQNLIRRVETEQQEKRRFELEVLQNQINPHLLYNTLNIIYSLCQVRRYEDAENTILALSDYYRIALSSGRNIIPLGDDVKNVRDYLSIQKQLFENEFDYNLVIVDDKLLTRDIVKLTIQPLVENAIKHGLRPKGHRGFLYIELSGNDDSTTIIVMDDGVGMPEERLHQLRNLQQSDCFGLRSVVERLQLYFHNRCTFAVDSVPDCGTTVRLTIPASAGQGEEEL